MLLNFKCCFFGFLWICAIFRIFVKIVIFELVKYFLIFVINPGSSFHGINKWQTFLLMFTIFNIDSSVTIKRPFVMLLFHHKLFFFKDCDHYIFASLVGMFNREHLRNKGKCFLFHLQSTFHSWDNQILTFPLLTCHYVSNCLSMKHETFYWITWEPNTVW